MRTKYSQQGTISIIENKIFTTGNNIHKWDTVLSVLPTHLGIYCTDYTYGLDDDTVYKIHSVMYMYIYYISCMLFAIFSVLVTKLDHMKDTFQY